MAIFAMSTVHLVQSEVLQSRGFALMAVYLLVAADVKMDSTSDTVLLLSICTGKSTLELSEDQDPAKVGEIHMQRSPRELL